MKKLIKTLGPALIFLICFVLVAIILIATIGFKVGVKYAENTQLTVNIGTEFDVKDIKEIAKNVFPHQSVLVQQVELYKDMAQITVKDASDEQIEELNSQINDKYGIDNKTSDIVVYKNANTQLRTIAKPYILPIILTFVIVFIYIIIRFRKLGVGKVSYDAIMTIIVPQALLFSTYAIVRIPINRLTSILSIIIYTFSLYALIPKFLNKAEKIKS